MLNGKDLGRAIERAIQLKLDAGTIKSQAEIARHFGIQPPSIADWKKKGSISKDKLPELWRYFSDVVGPEHWGLGVWPANTVGTTQQHPPAKGIDQRGQAATAAPDGKIPVLSWTEAVQPDVAREQAKEWIEVSEPLLRRHTFALRVDGNSMEPAFQAGDLIVVEPDLGHQSGDWVIVRGSSEGPASCKQLARDGDDWYLDPINPRHPTKALGDTRIIGVVRAMIKNFR